jgi:hypothetical protein
MSNGYYNHNSGTPASQSRGTSSSVRSEFDAIQAGFAILPTPAQDWGGSSNYGDDTGTANSYVVSVAPTYVTSYTKGLTVVFKATNGNTGASVINVNGLGSKPLVMPDGATALLGGVIVPNQMVTARYDGASFQMLLASSVNYTPVISGGVQQVFNATDAGANTASGTLANVTAAAQTITPKSASSKLVIECSFQAIVTASGAGMNSVGAYRLYDFTNSADIGIEYTYGTSNASGANVQTEGLVTIRAIVTNAVTTARSFTLRARASTGSPTVYATSHIWTITEIQN